MIKSNTVLTDISGSTATIWLNRPDMHNALDMEMISEFLNAIRYLNQAPGVRFIVIRGKGPSFCSGADLKWMQGASLLSASDNYTECESLARCFYELYTSTRITLCLTHGSAFGGAIGFVAACDLAYAEGSSVFAFSEVKLGLVPVVIAPYVLNTMTKRKAAEWMLSGRQFTAPDACGAGLINDLIVDGTMDTFVIQLLARLNENAPASQRQIKALINRDSGPDKTTISKTAAMLAEIRTGKEAKEGIKAFLERRKPVWDRE